MHKLQNSSSKHVVFGRLPPKGDSSLLCGTLYLTMFTYVTTIMDDYVVVLRSGLYNITAQDSEHAAWSALELSQEENDELLDVHYADQW